MQAVNTIKRPETRLFRLHKWERTLIQRWILLKGDNYTIIIFFLWACEYTCTCVYIWFTRLHNFVTLLFFRCRPHHIFLTSCFLCQSFFFFISFGQLTKLPFFNHVSLHLSTFFLCTLLFLLCRLYLCHPKSLLLHTSLICVLHSPLQLVRSISNRFLSSSIPGIIFHMPQPPPFTSPSTQSPAYASTHPSQPILLPFYIQ